MTHEDLIYLSLPVFATAAVFVTGAGVVFFSVRASKIRKAEKAHNLAIRNEQAYVSAARQPTIGRATLDPSPPIAISMSAMTLLASLKDVVLVDESSQGSLFFVSSKTGLGSRAIGLAARYAIRSFLSRQTGGNPRDQAEPEAEAETARPNPQMFR